MKYRRQITVADLRESIRRTVAALHPESAIPCKRAPKLLTRNKNDRGFYPPSRINKK